MAANNGGILLWWLFAPAAPVGAFFCHPELRVIPRADICIKFYVTAEMYLALRHRAFGEDRSISQHLRHLVRLDLHQACDALCASDRATDGSTMGQTETR